MTQSYSPSSSYDYKLILYQNKTIMQILTFKKSSENDKSVSEEWDVG